MPFYTPPQNAPQPAGQTEDVEAVQRRRSREDLHKNRKEINVAGRKAGEIRRDRDEANAELERAEAQDAAFLDIRSATLLLLVVTGLLPVAVFFLDVFLLNQISRYIFDLGENHLGDWAVTLGAFFVPGLIVFAETALSHQRAAAARAATQYGDLARPGDYTSYYMWTALALLIAVAIPFGVGTLLLAQNAAGLALSEISWKQFGPMGVVVVLSFVLHTALIFASDAMHTGQAYLVSRWRLGRKRRAARRLRKKYGRLCERVAEQLGTLEQVHERCDQLHPNEDIPLGPLSQPTREAVNEHFGYEYLPTGGASSEDSAAPSPAPDDGAAQAEPTPTPDEPTPAADGRAEAAPHEPPSDAHAMADYYRNVAEAQRRDADGEVQL